MSKKKYWGCEMESKLYWEAVNDKVNKRESLKRHLSGIETIEDYKTKRGKRK